jgi:hypothetical protein
MIYSQTHIYEGIAKTPTPSFTILCSKKDLQRIEDITRENKQNEGKI